MLRFENVGLRYGLGSEIIRDATFNIAPQSFQFLTGPSGAGKTTLLRLMLLSLKPTRGQITVFDKDAATLDNDKLTGVRRRIGVVFQDFRLLEHLTTFDNVALPLLVQGRSAQSYRPEVIELLKWVGLGDRINALPAVLSGGEKQRAAIARALIGRPELLLADEPTGNVDPGDGVAAVAAVRRIAQVRHFGRHRHPRSRADGVVRLRAQAGDRRRPGSGHRRGRGDMSDEQA